MVKAELECWQIKCYQEMITFDKVSKKFGHQVVLDQIELTIKGKEFVTIVGPSGAGKTTLLNLLIGSEQASEGSIVIDGYNISSLQGEVKQFYRRKLGIIFQDFKLLPRKTVYENVAFAMEACEYSNAEIKLKVPEVLEKVNLLKQKNNFPHQLSGGEKQRTAIARALVHDPKLIIADEPTGNLDPMSTREVIKILLSLNKNDGVTILLATHDRETVDYVQRRVIAIDQGRIVADKEISGYDIIKIEREGEEKFVEIINEEMSSTDFNYSAKDAELSLDDDDGIWDSGITSIHID